MTFTRRIADKPSINLIRNSFSQIFCSSSLIFIALLIAQAFSFGKDYLRLKKSFDRCPQNQILEGFEGVNFDKL